MRGIPYMKLVFLDRKSLGSDIDLSPFKRFGEIEMYDFSTPEEVDIRLRDADVAIINKSLINEKTIGNATSFVFITAPGKTQFVKLEVTAELTREITDIIKEEF